MSDKKLLELINSTPELISLLYDIGMMPEQLTPKSSAWTTMLAIAYAYHAGRDSVPVG